MSTLLAWMCGGLGLGILIGSVVTSHFDWKYIQLKAERENRTAIRIRDKFYYVIPEYEFVHDWVRKEHRL